MGVSRRPLDACLDATAVGLAEGLVNREDLLWTGLCHSGAISLSPLRDDFDDDPTGDSADVNGRRDEDPTGSVDTDVRCDDDPTGDFEDDHGNVKLENGEDPADAGLDLASEPCSLPATVPDTGTMPCKDESTT